jgi:hypothetical protein
MSSPIKNKANSEINEKTNRQKREINEQTNSEEVKKQELFHGTTYIF